MVLSHAEGRRVTGFASNDGSISRRHRPSPNARTDRSRECPRAHSPRSPNPSTFLPSRPRSAPRRRSSPRASPSVNREVRLYPFEHGQLYPALWAEISDRGWPGLLFGGEHGGSEGGLLAYAVVMGGAGARNLILWMPVAGASIGHAIAQVGPDHARERWLPSIASGETFLALAVTEPHCGHNVFRTKTTVHRDGDRFLVNGLKAVTSGIDLAERVLVFGRTAGRGGGATPVHDGAGGPECVGY